MLSCNQNTCDASEPATVHGVDVAAIMADLALENVAALLIAGKLDDALEALEFALDCVPLIVELDVAARTLAVAEELSRVGEALEVRS